MSWEEVEGKWDQLKGMIKEQWGKFTEDDIKVIQGKRDKLIGKLKERYGYAKERAEEETEKFLMNCGCSGKKSGKSCETVKSDSLH